MVGDEHRPLEWKAKSVDGYYQDADGTNIAIEFLGDMFHGHPSYWDKGTIFYGASYKELYAKTERTLQKLRSLGYRVFYVWEGDYKKLGALQSVRTILREFEDKLEA